MRTFRAAEALPVTIVVWGAFAFGAVYPWGYWPLIAMSVVTAAATLPGVGDDTARSLRVFASALCLFAAAAAVQLVPLSMATLARISPETVRVVQRGDAAGVVRSHALSIAPADTAIGLVLFAAFALLALASAKLFSVRGPRPFASALAAIGVALALAGIVQQPLSKEKIYGFWSPVYAGAPYGPFVNKNHFAGWMLMALPVTLGLLLAGLSRAMQGVGPVWRDRVAWFSSREASRLIFLAIAALVMALALVLTLSRSGTTSFALAILMTGAFVARRESSGGHSAVALAYLALLLVVALGWTGAGAIAARFSEGGWGGLSGRRTAWADALVIRSRFPLTGTGLNTYEVADGIYQQQGLTHAFHDAHNDYLQLAADGGLLLTVPAAACLVAFVVAVRRRFVQETSTTSYWLRIGAVTSLTAIALQETVEFSLQLPGNAALFAAVCGIALHRAPPRRRSHRAPPREG